MKSLLRTYAAICIAALLLFGGLGCTANERAKRWGGTTTYNLPPGKKLETVTWKEDSIWYLVRDMKPGEEPETHEFVQQSPYGVFEGKVIFHESKKN